MKYPPLSTGEIPQKDPRLFWVECVAAKAEIVFKVYSPKLWRRNVHFILGKGTFPCFPDHLLCEPCHDEKTLRFFGYLFGWHAQRQENAFMQLPVEAARQLLTQVKEGVDLRGSVIRVSRGRTANSRVSCKREMYGTLDGVPLHHDLDPDPSLHRMWENRRRRASFPPPVIDQADDFGYQEGDANSA